MLLRSRLAKCRLLVYTSNNCGLSATAYFPEDQAMKALSS